MGTIYIRRAKGLHLNSCDVPKAALDVAVETNSQIVFVEIIGQRGVTDINFTNAVTKRGMAAQLMFLEQGHTPRGDYGKGNDAIKVWRGQQILPYYQDKEVMHHPDLRGSEAEMHMLDYPRPSDWCFIDCFGYIPAAMHELGILFTKQKKYDNLVQFKQKQDYSKMTRQLREREWAFN